MVPILPFNAGGVISYGDGTISLDSIRNCQRIDHIYSNGKATWIGNRWGTKDEGIVYLKPKRFLFCGYLFKKYQLNIVKPEVQGGAPYKGISKVATPLAGVIAPFKFRPISSCFITISSGPTL